MLILKQPNNWSCTLTATCMLLGISVEQGIAIVGHDGSNSLGDGIPHRGFSLREMVNLCLRFNCALLDFPVEDWMLYGQIEARNPFCNLELIDNYMGRFRQGLLFGFFASDRPHTVVWNDGFIADPAHGASYLLDNSFAIESFSPFIGIKSTTLVDK